ncbi:hypothetical protein Desaci_4134 [Desulfosporosinus acidiphilus SJ4]|uniref:Uncharacterized protein n=1 Tax=Desulfosporosinus acidiphilus (strain DSM 22704 / JCM 16185 / SJ4) TaxID=646529 RepID=I4DB22_DESAJ|nr:hypothetical protein [Desulfosporosinus acidiphilus]AFM42996.1 hypothetical protein Desaci_4134 [Desulfosporosinus acidiphilus SJ4]
MQKEDRPGSFPLTIRFTREKDTYYDQLLAAPDPRKFIKSRLQDAATPSVNSNYKPRDPLERIADSLEQIVNLLKNGCVPSNHGPIEAAIDNDADNIREEPVYKTELSKRFSNILGDALKSKDWSGF